MVNKIRAILSEIPWPDVTRGTVGMAGIAAVVVGIWGLAGWQVGLIAAGLPVGGLYYALEVRALFGRAE